MRGIVAALALGCAVSLSAQTRPASPAPATLSAADAGGAGSTEVCAGASDAENLCSWDGPAGTHGRRCTLDVERIRRDSACRFDKAAMEDMADHKPMCISIRDAEHIAFSSSHGRHFRVRRLVPITARGANGQLCPRDPFGTVFDPTKLNFTGAVDSQAAKTEAEGCKYKLEVQFETQDPKGPAEPNDGQHRHFECRDPHLLLKSPPPPA